ncbi:transporter [Candidatus Campbellbacteria bacterium]|nr:MAG: transporter [Candidatus Campbellbacteria bacterium]
MPDFSNIINSLTGNIITDKFMSSLILYFLNVVILFCVFYLVKKSSKLFLKEKHSRYKFKKILTFLFYIILIGLTVVLVTQHNKHLTLFIGLVGAGVAFALQEVVLSIAGFISIFASNLFRLGDRIKIGDMKGDVIDIGITKTTLMEVGGWVTSDNYSGRIIQVPNSKIYKENILNYSLDFPFLWDQIKLPIKYGSDLKLTQEIILKTAKEVLENYTNDSKSSWANIVEKYAVENAKAEPDLIYNLTDNWIEFELRYVVDYKKRRHLRYVLHREIYKDIQNSNGQVQLASATFELLSAPDLNIKLNKE